MTPDDAEGDDAEGTERMDGRATGQPAWILMILGAASLFGAIVGTVALPTAWPAIALMTLAQLGVTALGVRAPRRPVLWAAAVSLVSLGSSLAHPSLADLAYSGASPWIGLATAAAALTLFRSARDRTASLGGSVALVLGLTGLVTVSVRSGIPVAPAILATSVYLLLGGLAAALLLLRDAREDRVRRPELAVAAEASGSRPAAATDPVAAARRALAIVVLRTDELAASTEDASARRAAVDLREVSRRALAGPDALGGTSTRIDVHPATAAFAGEAAGRRPPEPMPDLPDREREILRLVATGASNAVIARSLYLSEATVKQYVSRLMRKFQRENRTQLALMATRWFEDDQITEQPK